MSLKDKTNQQLVRKPSMSKNGRPIKYKANIENVCPESPFSAASAHREPIKTKSRFSDQIEIGLQSLPNELLYIILKQLEPFELGLLTLVSKQLKTRIYQYVMITRYGYKQLFPVNCFDDNDRFRFDSFALTSDLVIKFSSIGFFLKRLTILDPTEERIDLFCEFSRKLQLNIDFRDCTTKNYQQFKFRFKCYGALVQSFVLGWDESEIKRMVIKLEQTFSLKYLVKKYLRLTDGTQRLLEYYIRYFYRMVFFDSQKFISEKSYWVHYVIEQYTDNNPPSVIMVERSRLLILFFGPLIGHQGDVSCVGWESIHTALFIDDELSTLGETIEILNDFKCYTKSNIYLLVNALINFPTTWRIENQAALLYHCGISVAQQYFKYILRKEDITNVCNLLIFYSVVSSRKSNCNFFQIIDFLFKEDPNFFGNLKYLLREIPECFFRIALTKEAINFEDELEEDELDEDIDVYDLVKTLTEIMENLLHKVYPTLPNLVIIN